MNSKTCLFSFLASAIALATSQKSAFAATDSRVVDMPPTTPNRDLYVGNKAPLMAGPLVKLPIGSIKPEGWLKAQLELEANGMTGHLEEISKWCNFQSNAWSNPKGQGHSGWEELPYWLKGYGDLGYVLKDETIIAEARKWIDAVLSSQEADGWFGPQSLKTSLEGKPDLWPHMVMCNVLQTFYEYSHDERVPPFLTKYFKWQSAQPDSTFSNGYWPKIRFGDNIETIYWLYNRTGEAWLLDLSRRIHEHMQDWTSGVHNWHNVNVAQGFREPGIYYLQARDPKFLLAAEHNYQTVMDPYGQFPGGGFAADENARPGYIDPRQGFETCGIVEFMHSFEMLEKISGNPIWADRCEDLAFNSLPAALTPDAKGLHYLTCANQVQLDKGNKSPSIQNEGTMFSYSPFEVYRCCQHNVSHGWPYYAEELWLATADGGLCASLYSQSKVTAKVGIGSTVNISESTEYPFSEKVTLAISTKAKTTFALYLRVPGWCQRASVKVNGKAVSLKTRPSSFIVLEREWRDGDNVTLDLPMEVVIKRWPKNMNAASVNYGPLSFSLKIGEDWRKYGGRGNWPEYEVFPATAWNYGLLLDNGDPSKSFRVRRKSRELATQPFTAATTPIELTAKARKISAWQQDRQGLVGKLQPSPTKSDAPVETITLIPMGAARLRITTFPVIGTGRDAHEWALSKTPPVSASHCFENDSVEAMIDGLEPKSSHDPSIPRFTWWDRKGSTEWVQRDFAKPQRVSDVQVYWFDDTGNGSCRVPASWRILFKDDGKWKEVETSSVYGTKLDTYNQVTFRPIQVSALRIEAKLQPNFSGGILEWKCQ
jgi:hypothetical protein